MPITECFPTTPSAMAGLYQTWWPSARALISELHVLQASSGLLHCLPSI